MEVNKALEEAQTAQVFFFLNLYSKKDVNLNVNHNFLQNAARDAIKKANDDIASAKTDLEDVSIKYHFIERNLIDLFLKYLDKH